MQKSFSDLEYAAKKKLTRRDRFLGKIDSVTPWSKLHELIEPHYPKVKGAGRPPIGLARMLRSFAHLVLAGRQFTVSETRAPSRGRKRRENASKMAKFAALTA
jgi:hypothetical protein